MPRRPRVLFLVTEDWYFCSHRLPVARALAAAGFDVAVACRVTDHGTAIENEGFTLLPLELARRSLNPLAAMRAVRQVVRTYRAVRPDAVHHVALKAALLGSLAARLTRVPAVINAVAGLGFVFSSRSTRARLLRPVVLLALRALLDGRRHRVIVQNEDDGRMLTDRGIVTPAHLALIRGSGVDLARFRPRPEPDGPVRVAMVSRMIREKGVRELVEAARRLKAKGIAVEIVLAGAPDPENPASIPEEELHEWDAAGLVTYSGRVEDVAALWASCHIAALPSYYGEGVPLSLIEAAASGRPMIAADGPGLRDIVRAGETGLLVPARDARALADAIDRLAGDPELRARLGAAARSLPEREFGAEAVARATLDCYRNLLGPDFPDTAINAPARSREFPDGASSIRQSPP